MVSIEIQHNFSLKGQNTFGVDAKAKLYAKVSSLDELMELLRDPGVKNEQTLILGGGSNILLTEDFDGLVIKLEIMGVSVIKEDDDHVWVKVGAGEDWHQFTQTCIRLGWGGVENLSLIPGTVGAAPIQNIGAYGVELKQTFESLNVYDTYTSVVRVFDKLTCSFGYRNSIFKQAAWKKRAIIIDVTFKLSKNPKVNISYGAIAQVLSEKNISNPSIRDVGDAVIQIRRSKLPDPKEIGNCGSFFKNPEISTAQFEALKAMHPTIVGYPLDGEKVKVPAGWLIEQAGWKGKQVGNVAMHRLQALVLVNQTGQASGREAWEYALRVQSDVMAKFGISLVPEVNVI